MNRQLPIREERITVPAADRTLADGTPLVTLRWDRIEQEHYMPATMVRLVTLVEVMGTADTHEMVVRAPIPAAIVPRSKYTDALLIEMMVRKYMRGQPFYRILQDMRAMGSDLSDSTLSDLAQRMASFLGRWCCRSAPCARCCGRRWRTSMRRRCPPTMDRGISGRSWPGTRCSSMSAAAGAMSCA